MFWMIEKMIEKVSKLVEGLKKHTAEKRNMCEMETSHLTRARYGV